MPTGRIGVGSGKRNLALFSSEFASGTIETMNGVTAL